MKHGYGEFKWATGGHYKGMYEHDIKSGYGEMTWADGSIYLGLWSNGIQNGLGVLKFGNGIKKAGIFKDNVLFEMISDTQALVHLTQLGDKVPEKFKQEVGLYLKQLNPKEDQKEFLKKELKKNQFEEKTQPNTLLLL